MYNDEYNKYMTMIYNDQYSNLEAFGAALIEQIDGALIGHSIYIVYIFISLYLYHIYSYHSIYIIYLTFVFIYTIYTVF